jgi:2-polyprenyl-3-methyl-5-hydroxy-6-metoxy-1,4-benzoquinol methylase
MTWNDTYLAEKRVWGDKPSELAVFACQNLQKTKTRNEAVEILDIGCGYGRDAIYLAQSLKCRVLGIDTAREAIAMAQKALAGDLKSSVEFQCRDFKEGIDGKFGIVFASNVYQLLERENRDAFRDVVKNSLKRGGRLFLSTLSASDPEHFGKGKRVPTESNSFIDEKFLHLCAGEELRKDFGFLKIEQLLEHKYDEPRSNGQTHHHVSWLLMAENQ